MDAKIDFWLEVKEIFREISEKLDLSWQKRKRVLGPLWKNTQKC
jgi:hypothetical protein